MIDITLARLYHLRLKETFDNAVHQHNKHIEIESFDKCELGKWLYSTGLEVYKEINEIKTLEQEHKSFHAIADNLAVWYNQIQVDSSHETPQWMAERFIRQAENELVEFDRRSKNVIFLLTSVESKFLDIQYQKDLQMNQVRQSEIIKRLELIGGNVVKSAERQRLLTELKKLVQDIDENRDRKNDLIDQLQHLGSNILRARERNELISEMKQMLQN